jgi:fermentation-respiration switch protein FrsA (DUF1100 family)
MMFYIFITLVILLIPILIPAWLGSNYLMARRKPDAKTSPADYDLPFEDIEFQSGDGLTLRGWYIPAEHSARTVIFCAGANGSIDPDVQYAAWFHPIGLNVLIFDWRAHGRSDGTIVTLGYTERYDLIAAVEFAKSKGAQKIGVLGFSMGGAVALSTAAGCPDIDAVAADGAFVHVVTAIAGGLIERGWPDGLAYSLARLLLIAANVRTGLNLFASEPVRWIDRIAPRPLLLMYGARDPFAPRAEVDLLFARAREPKQLWRVPEAGHRDLHLYRAEEYRQRIVRFFNENLVQA